MKFVVSSTDEGERLDAWLASTGRFSRAEAQRLIDTGSVTVDGKKAKKSARVAPSQLVEITKESPAAPAIPARFVIRYSDEHLAVVSKPSSVVVHPAGKPKGTTLVEALSSVMPLAPAGGAERPGIVHRLDKGTSGLLVVGKTDDAYHALVASMKKREIKRTYRALVLGMFDVPGGRIDAPIGRGARNPTKMAVVGAGKAAVTEFRVIEEIAARLSLLDISLVTGRTHQVRVHLSHIGHPVVGDGTYGAKARSMAETLGLRRPFLHAYALDFIHPISGIEISVTDPLPEDLVNALEIAREMQ